MLDGFPDNQKRIEHMRDEISLTNKKCWTENWEGTFKPLIKEKF